jgi:hypothetical protein
MLMTDEMTKRETRARMQQESDIEVKALGTAGNIILMTPQECYFRKPSDQIRAELLHCGPH